MMYIFISIHNKQSVKQLQQINVPLAFSTVTVLVTAEQSKILVRTIVNQRLTIEAENLSELTTFENTKTEFKKLGTGGKFPTMNELKQEYAKLKSKEKFRGFS